MTFRSSIRLLGLSFLVLAAFAVTARAACSGVDRNRVGDLEWTVDLILDGSGQPLIVELEAKSIGGGTTVEYFDGTSWNAMSAGVPVQGSAIRFTPAGVASFRLSAGGCGDDDWTTSDDN
jgi:hypothetical protein